MTLSNRNELCRGTLGFFSFRTRCDSLDAKLLVFDGIRRKYELNGIRKIISHTKMSI